MDSVTAWCIIILGHSEWHDGDNNTRSESDTTHGPPEVVAIHARQYTPADPVDSPPIGGCTVAGRPDPFSGPQGQDNGERCVGTAVASVETSPLLRTRKKDPGHIPKPLNAFLCFRRVFCKNIEAEKQERLRELQSGPSSSETEGEMQQKHVSMRAGAAWNSLPAEEQAPYIREAAELKRLHELKYPSLHGKGSSAGKRTARTSKGAARKGWGRKGRKARAQDDLAAVLDCPSTSSSLHHPVGYDVCTSLPYPVAPSPEFIPVPTLVHPFDRENGWSTPSPHSDVLRLRTPALTQSSGLSPSPAPTDLYGFQPSANVSCVASPAVLDFASDGISWPDFSHPPMAPFIAPGGDFTQDEYQLYDLQPPFNGCEPLVPHHLSHAANPPPQAPAMSNGVFPAQFASQTIPAFDPMSLGTELEEAAQAEYFWPVEPVDQAPWVPAVDVNGAVNQDRQQFQPQPPVPLGMSEAQYLDLDWLFAQIASLPPCNDAFFSSSDF